MNKINLNTVSKTNVIHENLSCLESAKKLQSISGQAFGYLTLFYYLLVDLLAPCVGWFRKRQISEVSRHSAIIEKRQEIDRLLNKNFILIATNVPHVTDAEVICLGETHYQHDQMINNTQLIDALCNEERDLILTEYDERDPPKSLLDYQLRDLKHQKLKIRGWDVRGIGDDQTYNQWTRKCISLTQELKKTGLVSIGLCIAVIWLSILNLSFLDVSLLVGLTGTVSYKAWRTGNQLKEAHAKQTAFLDQFDLEFPERNRHMCQVIDKNSSSHGKIFVIAGNNHLRIPERPKWLSDKKWFDQYVITYKETMTFLRKKKFAVLVPRSV